MARTFTLATIRTAVRYRADIENSRHHSDAELNTYISASYTWLYDLLVNSGEIYAYSTQTITTLANTASYALSSDFYRLLRVRYQSSSTVWWRCRRIHLNAIDNVTTTGSWSPFFLVNGSNLELFPTPPAGQTYQVRYVPAPADLTTDGQTVDGISGWEELLIIDAAIKAMRKSEEDTSGLERDRAVLLDRIEKSAFDRLMAEPQSLFSEDAAEDYLDSGSWLIRGT